MSDLECVTFYFFLRMTVYGSYGLEVQILNHKINEKKVSHLLSSMIFYFQIY